MRGHILVLLGTEDEDTVALKMESRYFKIVAFQKTKKIIRLKGADFDFCGSCQWELGDYAVKVSEIIAASATKFGIELLIG